MLPFSLSFNTAKHSDSITNFVLHSFTYWAFEKQVVILNEIGYHKTYQAKQSSLLYAVVLSLV